ncbi:MAG: hypothetical protein ACO3N7_05675 [Kiritimatiellia bacterium]
MKSFLFFLFALFLLTGCAYTPDEKVPLDKKACVGRVKESMEYASNPAQTRAFFTAFVSNPGMDMEILFSELGRNLSSALLAMKDPYAQQISLRLNPDLDSRAFDQALTRRLFSGGSLLEMQDVVGMTMEGEFLRVEVEAPHIVSGYFYVICKQIEGRTIAEQTFVDYTRPAGGTGKLSVDALINLLL